MSALYETANDLTAIRDVDAILAAIVRRARSLLHADMTYLSLNDEADGASYMKVTDGALTPEFRRLRLPLGTGLLGLVAQTGEPYFTEDYQTDERFVHQRVHRLRGRGREDPRHPRRPADRRGQGDRRAARGAPHRAAVPARGGVAADVVRRARRRRAGERPALRAARPRQPAGAGPGATPSRSPPAPTTSSPTCCCTAAGWREVADVVADVLQRPRRGARQRGAPAGRRRRGPAAGPAARTRSAEARASGRSVEVAAPTARRTSRWRWPAPSTSAPCCCDGLPDGLGTADRRTLERGALVTALVLLFGRIGRRGRGAGARRAAQRPAGAAATSTGPAAGAGPPPAAPTSTARRRWRWPPSTGIERHRAAQVAARLGRRAARAWPASTTAGWCWSRRPRGPARGRPAAARAGARGRRPVTVGVAPAAGRADRRRRRPTARPGGCLDTLLTLGRDGRGQRPGRARAGPAAARAERPRGARRVHRGDGRPGAGLRRPARHRAGRPPWRPGSPPAPGPRRPPSGCTCTRTPSPSGSTGSAPCSARTGATRPAASTSSSRCGSTASAPADPRDART